MRYLQVEFKAFVLCEGDGMPMSHEVLDGTSYKICKLFFRQDMQVIFLGKICKLVDDPKGCQDEMDHKVFRARNLHMRYV